MLENDKTNCNNMISMVKKGYDKDRIYVLQIYDSSAPSDIICAVTYQTRLGDYTKNDIVSFTFGALYLVAIVVISIILLI